MGHGTAKGGTGVTTKHVGLDFYFFERADANGATIYFGRADGVGIDVVFRSGTSGAELTWDESAAKLIMDGVDLQLEDADELRFGDLTAGDITMNFDGTSFELEGAAASTPFLIGADSKLLNTTLKGTLTIGKDGTGHDVVIHGDTTGAETTFNQSLDKWIHDGITVQLQDDDELRFGDLAAGDFRMYFDNSALVLKPAITSSWNIGIATSNVNTTLHGTLTIGESGTGYDVIIHGDTTGAEITFNQALDKLIMDGIDLQLNDDDELRLGDLAAGDFRMYFDSANLVLKPTTTSSWNIGVAASNVNTTLHGTLTIGESDVGYDVIIHGDNAGSESTFDQANNKWVHDGIDVQLNDASGLRFGSLAAGDIVMNFDSSKFELEGAAAATSWNIGADSKLINTTLKGTFTIGKSGTGHDVLVYGDTPLAVTTFDQANDKWTHDGIDVQLQDTDELRFGDLAAGDIVMNFDASKFETTGAAASTTWTIGAGGNVINMVQTGTVDITGILTMETTNAIQLRDSGLKVYSSADAQLDLVSDGVIKLDGKLTHMAPLTQTMGGDKVLSVNATRNQFLDPDGSNRTITLPTTASADGIPIVIVNKADAGGEVITLIDTGANTIVAIDQNETGWVICDGNSWGGGTLKAT